MSSNLQKLPSFEIDVGVKLTKLQNKVKNSENEHKAFTEETKNVLNKQRFKLDFLKKQNRILNDGLVGL